MNIAIITGASSGLGREFARQIDRTWELDEIWLIARRENRLKELSEELKTPSQIFPLDLTDRENIQLLAHQLEKQNVFVRLLVNSSGYGKFGNYQQVPLQSNADMIDLNCRSLVEMTQSVLPFMQNGAQIIEIASVASFFPLPYMSVYAASKAFVLSYSRALNQELKPKGISVTALCPYWVKTEFIDVAKIHASATSVTRFPLITNASDVVSRALKAAGKGRDLCTYGVADKMLRAIGKLLPHSFIMKVWIKLQKH